MKGSVDVALTWTVTNLIIVDAFRFNRPPSLQNEHRRNMRGNVDDISNADLRQIQTV